MASDNYKMKFLKPEDESFKEDRSDIDSTTHTSFVFNPHKNQSIDRQRQKLPVFAIRTHFLYLIENFQTLLVVGETGSGKSTQLPQYLLESGWSEDGMIGIAQPRRVACTSLASRVAEEQSCLLSQEVGYSIRFDDCTTPGVTKIKYLTEGLLVREIMGDPLLRQYSVIMLDEVHERTLYTDIILGLMKKIMKRRKDLKLIISSATFDAETLYNFFNANKTKDKSKDTASILSIQGRTFPVDIHYLKDSAPSYIKASAETALKIHTSEAPGAILIFLTGVDEIEECIEMLTEEGRKLKRKDSQMMILPMHGSLPYNEQLKVFQYCPPEMRKVVVATNIAETSITIPDVVYIIDCGFVKLRWYNSSSFCDSLVIVPTSKASAIQRSGRAGRTRSGKIYRLYQESEYEKLSLVTPPEMVRTNLNSAVLNLMALGIDNMLRFDFPSPPPSTHLVSALDELFALGALDENGQLTKPLGDQMAQMPLPPQIAKMLLVSGEFGCAQEVLSIISMLQVQNVFVSPYGKRREAKIMHRKFQVAEGDLLTLLNVFTTFEEQASSKRFCSEHFINYRSLKRAQEIRNSMAKVYSNFNLPLSTSEGAIDPICRCICAGMFPNAAFLHFSGDYKTIRGQQTLHIHPSSVLYDQKQPQWVLFHELMHTSKIYMRDITVIEKHWLTEMAPHFYETVTLRD